MSKKQKAGEFCKFGFVVFKIDKKSPQCYNDLSKQLTT